MLRTLTTLLASTCYAPADGGGAGGSWERLGTMDPLPGATGQAAALIDTVNHQRVALLDAKRRGDEQAETLARMQAELAGKLKEFRATPSHEWTPSGDVATMEARYVVDGAPVLSKRTLRVPSIGINGEIEEVEETRPGFLTDPYPVHRAQKEAQEAFAAFALTHHLARASKGPDTWRELHRKAYRGLVRALCEVPGTIGAWSRHAFASSANLRAALSSTAGSGGELIQTPTLGTIVRPADIQRRIAAQIPMVAAPSSAFKKPAVSGRVLWRKRQAIAADPSRFTVSSVTTTDSTLTLVPFFAQVLVDNMFPQNAGLVLGDAVGYIRGLIAQGKADTLEMMLLHGDTAGTHQDPLATWTMGSRYTAGDLAGTESPLTAWLGFRARAYDGSATVAGGGAFTATTHYGALNKLGALAAGARMSMGLVTFYSQILANALFTTVDKAGALATLQTGQLGQVGDTPIDLTDFLAGEYASTGLYTGSGTTGQIVYYSPDKFVLYQNAANSTEWEVNAAERGALYIGAQDEMLLDCWAASGENAAAVIYNL